MDGGFQLAQLPPCVLGDLARRFRLLARILGDAARVFPSATALFVRVPGGLARLARRLGQLAQPLVLPAGAFPLPAVDLSQLPATLGSATAAFCSPPSRLATPFFAPRHTARICRERGPR